MRRKVLVSLALLLCLCTLFVSCGSTKTLKFSKLYDKDMYVPKFNTPTSATKLSVEGEYTDSEGSLVLFTKVGSTGLSSYSVYNMEKSSVVFTADASETTLSKGVSVTTYTIKLEETNDVSWFYVIKNTTTTSTDDPTVTASVVTLYKADGTSVASAETKNAAVNEIEAPMAMCDLIYFDDAFYRISDDGNIEKAFDYSAFRTVPMLGLARGDYYYGSFSDSSLVIFDKELNVLVSYDLPDYADSISTAVLESGDIFVQYQTTCNDHCEDYTYVDEDATKFHVTSLIIDAKSGKEKEVELDYVVNMLYCRDDLIENGNVAISDNIDNLAYINYIVDERIDFSESASVFVSIGNDMKVKAVIDGYIPGILKSINIIANNRWIASNHDSQSFLLNEDGDVLGEISEYDALCDIGIIVDNKIYDWNLELTCDLNEQNAVDYSVLQNCVVFKTFDGETKVYADGSVKTLISEDDTKRLDSLGKRGFVIVNEKTPTEFTVYNDKAEAVYTSDKNLTYTTGANVIVSNEDAAIILLPCLKSDLTAVSAYILLK